MPSPHNIAPREIGGKESGTSRLIVMETTVDLDGNAAPQRLEVIDRKLVVSNGRGEKREEWRLNEIDGFRIEPSLGSCFLQAHVGGRWVDVVRRPGDPDREIADALTLLESRCRRGFQQGGGPAAPRETPPPGAAGPAPLPGPARRWRATARLLALLRPFRGSVLLLMALSMAAVAVEVVPPLLQGYLVDHILKPEIANAPQARLLLLLAAIVAGLLLARLATTLVGIWKGRVSSRVGTSMTANLRDDLGAQAERTPLGLLRQEPGGDAHEPGGL